MSYTETGDGGLDLDRLALPSGGHMDGAVPGVGLRGFGLRGRAHVVGPGRHRLPLPASGGLDRLALNVTVVTHTYRPGSRLLAP